MASPEEIALISRAQRGDISAFEKLIYRYDKQVLSIAARYVRSSEDAKDIYQEVLIKVYKGLPKFKGLSEFSTWLYRITTNVCLSHKEHNQRRNHASIDDDRENDDGESHALKNSIATGASSDQHTLDSEIAFHIREAMEGLSPQQKLVFNLRHYHGYKLKEIAEMMNCAEGTVKKYLFTATRRMRDELQEIFE
jgi:RNA polymerase sigma-70 factor (ECF subfamily)